MTMTPLLDPPEEPPKESDGERAEPTEVRAEPADERAETADGPNDGGAASTGTSTPDGEPRPDGGLATAIVDATFEIPTADGTARMSVPGTATPDEAAAVAAALAAHIAGEDDTEPEAAADPWVLAGRLGCRRRSELPRECSADGAWAAAARHGR